MSLAKRQTGAAMFEVSVDRSAADVIAECLSRGLMVKYEQTVNKRPGGYHWHLGYPRRTGVLELTELGSELTLKVMPRRDGGWATQLARELAGV